MRALLRQERHGSPLQVLTLSVLLAVTSVALALTFATRQDASDARRSARADRDALLKVRDALRTQCAQQVEMTVRLRALEHADIDLQRGLIAADRTNLVITQQIRDARRRVYERKLQLDLAFVAGPAPTPAVCAPFAQDQPIAFRAQG